MQILRRAWTTAFSCLEFSAGFGREKVHLYHIQVSIMVLCLCFRCKLWGRVVWFVL
jgi:hypothetical protein